MSQKYKAYVEVQKRDEEICQRPGCGHKRGWHIGDKFCIARQVNQCACTEFVPKEAFK